MKRLQPLRDLPGDMLYGVRLIRRSPAYSLVVVAVLAVGIAANLIAFGLFKAVALTPLAGVGNSGSLLFVGARSGAGQVIPLSYPDYADIRARAFPGLAAWGLQPLILTHRGSAALAQTELVTGNYFDVLGARMQLGRSIDASDVGEKGQRPVVVISDGLWRRVFGRDAGVIGTTIRVNNYPLTVIGVSNPAFRGGIVGLATDLFVPITMQPVLTGNNELDERDEHWVHAFMRPGPGGRAATAARATQVANALAAEHRIDTLRDRAAVVPIWQWPYGAQSYMLPAVGLLGAMATLLLVVVSANVAGLVLVRSLARRGETAARLTLGATRGRIVRQLIVESLVLAVPAAVIGFWLPALLESFLGAAAANVSLPLFFNTAPDRLVIGVTALLAIVSALLYGVGPALHLSRVELSEVLKDDLAPGGRRASRMRSALVVAQIAVALVLLIGTSLVLRTLSAAQRANAGFDPQHVTWATFDARAGGYDERRGRLLYSRLLEAVRADPAVTDASMAAYLPLTLVDWMSWNAQPDGYQLRRDEPAAFAVNIVSSGYFRTLRIPIVAGREFNDTDTASADLRLIVNETFARRFFGTAVAAIGRIVETGGGTRSIVGVVRDIKYARLDESPRPYMYVPVSQAYGASMTLQARGADAATVLARIRAHAQAIDPALAVLRSGPMTETLRSATSIYETLARIVSLIGVLAVVVATLGVYGLVAYTVKQKAHEIGVRSALGATRASLVRHLLSGVTILAASGAVLGVVVALGVGQAMSQLLFGVAATDLTSFTVAPLVVLASALAASLAPAWRAARQDPIAALRHR